MSKKQSLKNSIDTLFENLDSYSDSTNIPLEDQIEKSMLSYGTHIIEERSIPSIYDGLKPVQRRALYTFLYKNTFDKNVKLANITGACMGEFHPHGDSSINECIANLTQPWKNNLPLLEGQGNWGSAAGDKCGAMRYIEVKMTSFIKDLLFSDINKTNVIPWEKTFDESKLEPSILPVKLPLNLINGTDGIAYSMATSIPMYNPVEIVQLMIYMIENKFYKDGFNPLEHSEKMHNIVKGIDTPTKSNVYYKDGDYLFDSNFGVGYRASLELDEKNSVITVSNFPVGIPTDRIKDEILSLAKDYIVIKKGKRGKEEKVPKSDQSEVLQLKTTILPLFHYEQDEFGKRDPAKTIAILHFKSSADLKIESLKLLSKTSLDTSFRANINVINSDSCPINVSLYENLYEFLKFRMHCVYQSLLFDIDKIEKQVHLLTGLKIVLSKKDLLLKIIAITDDFRDDLIKNFPELTDIQLNYVMDSKITKLTKNEIIELEKEINLKINDLDTKTQQSSTEDAIYKLILEDYQNLLLNKKFSKLTRQSKIIDGTKKITAAELIEDDKIALMVMDDGTIGYISISGYKSHNQYSKMKNLQHEFNLDGKISLSYFGNRKDKCIFVSNKGKVYKEDVWKFSKRFININNYLSLESDEKIIFITKDDENTENTHILFFTKNSTKNMSLSYFKNAKAERGILGIKLKENDVVKSAIIHNPLINEEIIIISNNGGILRFNKNQIPEYSGKYTMGTRVLNQGSSIKKQKTEILNVFLINEKESYQKILCISDKGKAKLVQLSELQEKEIKLAPISIFKNNESNGYLLKCFVLDENKNNEITLISETGKISLIKLNDLRVVSRIAGGSLKLISNTENEKITNCLLLEREETEEVYSEE